MLRLRLPDHLRGSGKYFLRVVVLACLPLGIGPWATANPDGASTSPLVQEPAGLRLEIELPNPLPQGFDRFGYAVAITQDENILIGDVAHMAAGFKSRSVPGSGSAHLFDGSTGDRLLTIEDPTPQPFEAFGNAVATDSSGRLLVSDFGEVVNGEFPAGAVFIFDQGGQQVGKLIDLAPRGGDLFGFAVAVGPSDQLAVGSLAAGSNYEGRVRIFSPDGVLVRTLKPPTADSKQFGYSVAIAEDGRYLVGAPHGDGAVFVFDNGGKLDSIYRGFGRGFGASLAIAASGDVIIGAPSSGFGRGTVHIFDGLTGILRSVLSNPFPDTDDSFGESIAVLSTGEIAIGAPTAFDGSGAVFIFDEFGQFLGTLRQPSPQVQDRFGHALSTGFRSLAVGAPLIDSTAGDAGAAFYFRKPLFVTCFPVIENFEDQDFSDWTLDGIGHANQFAAEVIDDGGDYELAFSSDGATAYYGADNAGFLYRRVEGDFRLEADIDSKTMVTGKPWRKAGLMVRASLDHLDIRLLAMLAPVQERLQFVAREVYGGPGNVKVATEVHEAPPEVRLAIQRIGQQLRVQYSLDGGETWITPTTGLGGSIEIERLPDHLFVGPAVLSNDISVPTTALFDDVLLCGPNIF